MIKSAWNVPNSRVIVTLNKQNYSDHYVAGIRFKSKYGNIKLYDIFKVNGNDAFQAMENLIKSVNEMSELWFEIFEIINYNEEIYNFVDWWNAPNNKNDFEFDFFKGLVNLYRLHLVTDKKMELKSILFKNKKYYCALVDKNCNFDKDKEYHLKESLCFFMGNGFFDRKEAFNNLKNNFSSTVAFLDKIQTGAWNAMIDTEHPDYKI